MAELATAERLQPSLLDRLTDDEPDRQVESRERRVISVQKLREIILRDLAWLLNTGNLAAVEDLGPYPEVARSVVNYGIPDLTGLAAASLDTDAMERAVRQSILDFEPRIIASSLQVRAVMQRGEMSNSALVFRIEGDLWALPAPIALFLRTEVDLETGQALVTEGSR